MGRPSLWVRKRERKHCLLWGKDVTGGKMPLSHLCGPSDHWLRPSSRRTRGRLSCSSSTMRCGWQGAIHIRPPLHPPPATHTHLTTFNRRYPQDVSRLQKEGKAEDTVRKRQVEERPVPKVQMINKLLYTLSSLTCRPGPAWFAALGEAWKRQLK